jgi:hypothetical protein
MRPREGEAVHIRHHDVQDDEVRGLLFEAGQGLPGAFRQNHLVARARKEDLEEVPDPRIVVHHQEPRHLLHGMREKAKAQRKGRVPWRV